MWFKIILILGCFLFSSNTFAVQTDDAVNTVGQSLSAKKAEESFIETKIISQRINDLYVNLQIYAAVAGILLALFGFFNWRAYVVKSEVEKAAKEIERKRTDASRQIDEHVDSVKAVATTSIEKITKQVGDITSLPASQGVKDSSTRSASEAQEQMSSEKKEGLEKALVEVDTATDRLLSSFPKEMIFAAAYQANLKGQYNKAMSLYDKFLKMEPNSSEGHNNLGLACSNTGLFDAALTLFDKAIQLNPSNLVAHFNKAEVLFKREQYNEALELFEKVSIAAPEHADTYNYKGLCQEKLGDFRRALACYRKAYEIQPSQKIYLYNIIGAEILNGNLAIAREMLEKEDAHTPTAHTTKLLGHIYLLEGNYEEAKKSYEEAFNKLQPNAVNEFLDQIENSDIEAGKKLSFDKKEEALEFLLNWVKSKRQNS